MATRTVTGADGRSWRVSRNIEWSTPATGSEFEHEVDGGRGAIAIIVSALLVFWVTVVVWSPSQVHVPGPLWLIAAVAVAFFPVRWTLRRPWTIVAETEGSYVDDPEHWTGLVRGVGRAKEEMRYVKRNLETRSTPGHSDSPLQKVD